MEDESEGVLEDEGKKAEADTCAIQVGDAMTGDRPEVLEDEERDAVVADGAVGARGEDGGATFLVGEFLPL